MPTASDTQFQQMIDAVPALIWCTDAARQFTFVNQAWLDFTGRTRPQEFGQGWAEGLHPADRERVLAMFAGHFDSRAPYRVEYRLRRADGTWRWMLEDGTPRTEAGAFAGYIGSCVDITGMKDLEQQWQQDLVDKAELLQNLQHRVRNDAQLFGALLQLQTRRTTDAAAQQALRILASRADAITVAQEQMHLAGSAAAFDLGLYANTLVQTARLEEGNRITIAVEAPEPVLVPLTDAVSLGLVLNELLVNALRHAFPNGRSGRITIMLWREPAGALSVVVADDGVGLMPGRDLAATQSAGGRIVEALARQLGATVEVGQGPGTRVTVAVPAP